MDRWKPLYSFLVDAAKLVGMVATVFAFCYGCARAYSWVISRADATEVAVLKSQRVDDSGKTDYILRRVDIMGDQLNHLALTGRVNYVTPPPPPAPQQVIGPQLPAIKVTP